jgi:hypothetical protein
MPSSRPFLAVLRRWDQVLVLSLVIVGSNLVSTRWLAHNLSVSPAGGSAAARGAPTPSAAIFDDAMASALQRAARANGLDPAQLPAPRHLWSLFAQQSPAAAMVDVEDHAAVEAALAGFVGKLAASERRTESGGPSGPGPEGPQPPGHGPDGAPDAGPVAGGPAAGSPPTGEPPPGGLPAGGPPAKAPPTIARIDQERAAQLAALAREKGLDPTDVLPDDALRRAAVESGELGSAASQELLEAYRAAMIRLDSQAP